jgi:hypothetical protein
MSICHLGIIATHNQKLSRYDILIQTYRSFCAIQFEPNMSLVRVHSFKRYLYGTNPKKVRFRLSFGVKTLTCSRSCFLNIEPDSVSLSVREY